MLKIHKHALLLYIIGFLILNLNLRLANAGLLIITEHDDDGDDDGVSDELEELNNRIIQFEFEENETSITSISNSPNNNDLILVKLTSNQDGLKIKVGYNSKHQSSDEISEFELEYSIIFCKIIEYIDSNENNIYNPSEDQLLQEIGLNSWNPIEYSNYTNDNKSTIHSIQLDTSSTLFFVQLFFVEEYERINESLITPNEFKIDIIINNFNYTHPNSLLALCIKLEHENEFKEVEETEDERLNYTSNEEGIITTSSKEFTGFFTWNQTVKVDGVLKNVTASQVMIDDEDTTQEKIYINYPRGSIIIHDPKIGIIRNVAPDNTWFILLIGISSFLLILGSISIPIYYKYKKTNHINRSSAKILEKLTDKSLLYSLFEEKFEEKDNIKDINLTFLPDDFFEQVDSLDLDDEDKEKFIDEMLGLPPDEIKKILDDMLNSYDV